MQYGDSAVGFPAGRAAGKRGCPRPDDPGPDPRIQGPCPGSSRRSQRSGGMKFQSIRHVQMLPPWCDLGVRVLKSSGFFAKCGENANDQTICPPEVFEAPMKILVCAA